MRAKPLATLVYIIILKHARVRIFVELLKLFTTIGYIYFVVPNCLCRSRQ